MEIRKISLRKEFIKKAANWIEREKIIICPTDTVYGLVADFGNKEAVERVFKIKKREKGKPIPIFVKDIEMAKDLALIDKEKEKFLKKVWPGKTTVVLKSRSKGKIGLRIPDYRFVNLLLDKLNRPLTGTSANISGRPASTKIKEVLKQFEGEKNQPDLIIDAGDLPESSPSTVVDLTRKKIKILRQGDARI